MVSKSCMAAGAGFTHESPSIENLRRIQFTAFFANFRRINLNANTCDVPKAVSLEGVRRAGATTTRNGRPGRKMWFLLRLTFWLGLVLVLLPRDKTPQSDKLPQIGASEAVQAATAAVSDMSQFCTRQPDACQIGSQALVHFGHKAQAGAKWLYDTLTSKAGSAQTPAEPAKAVAETDSQNTLTQADTMPAWRGSGQRQADLKRPQ